MIVSLAAWSATSRPHACSEGGHHTDRPGAMRHTPAPPKARLLRPRSGRDSCGSELVLERRERCVEIDGIAQRCRPPGASREEIESPAILAIGALHAGPGQIEVGPVLACARACKRFASSQSRRYPRLDLYGKAVGQRLVVEAVEVNRL